MGKRSSFDILSGLALVGQLGITLIFPVLLCTFIGVWLQERFRLGVWVIIVSILVGAVTAGCSFYHFARSALARAAKQSTASLAPKDDGAPPKEDSHDEN